MLISSTKKFCFVHIPKTGGTSVKKLLLPYADDNQIYFDENDVVRKVSGKYVSHPALSATEYAHREDFFKFAVVRNPFSWLASLYLFIQRTPTHFLHTIVADMSMTEFLAFLHADKRAGHLHMTQADYVADQQGQLLVDKLCRFEQLNDDVKEICTRLEIPQQEPIGWLKKAPAYDYRTMYSQDDKDFVFAHFARDFQLFNYGFE